MFVEFIGIVSGILVLFGYFANNFNLVPIKNYHIINLFSSSLGAMYLYQKTAYISVALNIIWFVIALVSLILLYIKTNKTEEK